MRAKCGPIDGCHGCGGPVPRGRRVWCSNACETRILNDHYWSFARAAVLKRDDYRCVVCGSDDNCREAREWRYLHGRSYLEVNHINPVNGRRKHFDCQNHQDNLETLCHDCHIAITKQQRELGLIGGRRRHIWKAMRLTEMGFVQCAKCGAVDTSVHIGPNVRVGTTIWRGTRVNEECTGPLLRHKRRRR